RGFGLVRGLLLLALSVPVIAAVNAVRVVVSGVIQEHAGRAYLRGSWHDALGVAMVLLGLGLVLLLARALGKNEANLPPRPPSLRGRGEESPGADSPPSLAGKGAGGLGLCTILAVSAAATVAAQLLGSGAEGDVVASAPLDEVPLTLGPWTG